MTTNIEAVKSAILTKDREKTVEALTALQLALPNDEESIARIIMPVVITELHQMLIDNLGVHPRAMLLKARVPNKNRRANLFVQAMINGVRLSK